MNKTLKKFLYIILMLTLLNPFMVFVALGCLLVQPEEILDTLLWLTVVIVYSLGWYKVRSKIGEFDSECVRLYFGGNMRLKYVVYRVNYFDYEGESPEEVDEFSTPEKSLNYCKSLGGGVSGCGGYYHRVVVEGEVT